MVNTSFVVPMKQRILSKENLMKYFMILFLVLIHSTQASEFDMIIKACQDKKMNACYDVGLFYEQGINFEQNITTAKHFFSEACEAGVSEACIHLEDIDKP